MGVSLIMITPAPQPGPPGENKNSVKTDLKGGYSQQSREEADVVYGRKYLEKNTKLILIVNFNAIHILLI